MENVEKRVAKLTRKPLSREKQANIYYRDKWLCRWCKKPVIFPAAMKYLQQWMSDAGFNSVAYWRNSYDRRGAPLLDELAAVLDHVVAHSTNGPATEENLVTACNRCNMSKNNSDATIWERKHPLKRIKSKTGEPENWDGLVSLFLFLAREKYAGNLTQAERDWVKALKNARSGARL